MSFDLPEIVLRLGVATLIGIVIGINRDITQKPIGSRTLGLVALGAASVALAGMQVPGMSSDPNAMSRVVQGVIQGVMGGISFVGAGVILRDPRNGTVDGLTTAATVWATAAIGIACAFAAWTTVAVATGIALILLISQRLLDKFGWRSPD